MSISITKIKANTYKVENKNQPYLRSFILRRGKLVMGNSENPEKSTYNWTLRVGDSIITTRNTPIQRWYGWEFYKVLEDLQYGHPTFETWDLADAYKLDLQINSYLIDSEKKSKEFDKKFGIVPEVSYL